MPRLLAINSSSFIFFDSGIEWLCRSVFSMMTENASTKTVTSLLFISGPLEGKGGGGGGGDREKSRNQVEPMG